MSISSISHFKTLKLHHSINIEYFLPISLQQTGWHGGSIPQNFKLPITKKNKKIKGVNKHGKKVSLSMNSHQISFQVM